MDLKLLMLSFLIENIFKGDLISWINMFDKAPFEGVDEEVADEIKKEAQENLKTVLCEDGKWFVDYVRLRFKGVKVL